MARGGASPVPLALPVVSFTKVEDDFSSKRFSVPEQPTRSYGYNDGTNFQRPEHYIRYIEPLESELAVQVEYDMDEQDQCWLDALNAERRAKDLGSVPYEVFEIVMDRLEKEWFDLTKNIPKPDLAMPSEDSTCAICDDSEGENTNAIVFCDGCNLAVHQDCYGVPYIPEGQWLCRKCTVSPENPVSCILCPNEGGAFKQTVQGDWVHLLCAIWVPETRVANDVFMEPVTGVDKISKQRWKLKCSICDIREGACIQCTKASCFLAFHATCARKEKLLMPMKSSQGSEAPTLACYCEKHLPREQAEARAAALAAECSDETSHNDPQAFKTARAYAKTYKPGPPLVPQIIVRRIEQYISRLQLRHKREFIVLVCKYWSLKREARRGAPLLKRLHLEPWTASAGGRNQSDEEKAMKLEHIKRVRQDLESLRNLAVACRRRESRKLEQQNIMQKVFSQILLARQPMLRMTFENIMAWDKFGYFKDPVSKVEVPDYYDIIKKPICWSTIDAKLDRYEYWDVQALKDDIQLVLTNAMIYNKADTVYWKTAQRIKNASEPIFAELEKRTQPQPAPQTLVNGDTEASPIPPPQPAALGVIGDVEPPLELLGLFVARDTIQDDRALKFLLEKDPIEALLSFELPKLKPVPPPAPSSSSPRPSASPEAKPKRNRKAERERRLARAAAVMEAPPALRNPKTRAAHAAVAAFVAESVEQGEEAEGEASAAHEAKTTMAVDSGATQLEGSAEVEAAMETTAVIPAKRKHKRPSITLPGQSEVPPVVEDINDQQSFKMFDAGWILPNDHRRGGRAPVEKHPLPEPKRKKARTGEREKSHLSTLTTSPAVNETLLPPTGLSEFSEPPISSISPLISGIELLTTSPVNEEPMHGLEHIKIEPSVQREAPPAETEAANLPLPEPSDHGPSQEPAEEPASSQEPMEESAPPASEAEVHMQTEKEGPRRVIIIEELDTPATRREKNMRKKAEKAARLAAEAEARAAALREAPLELPESERPEQPELGSEEEDVEMASQSELTSLGSTNGEYDEGRGVLSGSLTPVEGLLSEVDETEDRGDGSWQVEGTSGEPPEGTSAAAESATAKLAVKTKKPRRLTETERGKLRLSKGKFLEGGTLVWAKLATYPWWPAVVFEPDDPDVDQEVARSKTPQQVKKHKLHLVRFYDNKDYWEWMEPDKLRMLGDDADLDADMLATTSTVQKWKNSRTREALRKSYRRALAEMETGGADNAAASSR